MVAATPSPRERGAPWLWGCPTQGLPPLSPITSQVCPIVTGDHVPYKGGLPVACCGGGAAGNLSFVDARVAFLLHRTVPARIGKRSLQVLLQLLFPAQPTPFPGIVAQDSSENHSGRRARPVRGFPSFLPQVPAARVPAGTILSFCWRILKPEGQGDGS